MFWTAVLGGTFYPELYYPVAHEDEGHFPEEVLSGVKLLTTKSTYLV